MTATMSKFKYVAETIDGCVIALTVGPAHPGLLGSHGADAVVQLDGTEVEEDVAVGVAGLLTLPRVAALRWFFATLIAMPVLALLLIPVLGNLGAAFASLASNLVYCGVLQYSFYRKYGHFIHPFAPAIKAG